MDDGTWDAGGVAAGGRPGMPLLVPVQRFSSLSSLVFDPNGDLADPRPETRRPRVGNELAGSRLLGGLVRSAAKPESRDFADFGKEEKMRGTKVDCSLGSLGVGTEVESEDKKENSALDIEAGTETEVVKVLDSPEEESGEEMDRRNFEVESPEKKKLREAPMSPLRKMMSDQWNVLSRNLPPLPHLKAMSPLALLLRRGGDVVLEEKVRKGRTQPIASNKGGSRAKKWVNKKSFLASVSRRRSKLLNGIEKDFYSETSRAPKDSRRLTIKKLLKSEVVKLDVVKIKLIATAFKEAGYKSGSSYLAEAKLMHVEEGGDWTPQLDRVFKMSKRALDRGKGPRKKAPEVPVQVRKEALIKKKKLNTKVLFPRELFQFGIAWMLREVEIRFFEVRDLAVDWQKKRITLCWRTSKCDQSGEEVRRTLPCLCAGDMCAWECPFFSTIDLLDKVKKAKGSHSKLALNGDGSPLRKAQLLEAWCEVFEMKATGHSARRSGALHYIREGWDIPQVGYLGRWKSAMILEYAKEALELTPANKASTPSSWTSGPSHLEVADLVAKNEAMVRKQVESLKKNMETVKMDIEAKMKDLEKECETGGGCLPPLVQSLAGKVVHVNVALVASAPPVTWRTRCGWFFGKSNFCFINGSADVTCLKCKAAQSTEDEF